MIVYKATNIINNKIYIGITKYSLENRKKRHLNEAKHHKSNVSLIQRALNKYGEQNFKWKIIDKANSIKELKSKEIYWIDFYKSTNLKIGYNLTKGGEFDGCLWNKEQRKIQSIKYSGKGNPFYGKTHSDEIKKKISLKKSSFNHQFFNKKRPEHSKAILGNKNGRAKLIKIITPDNKEIICEGDFKKKCYEIGSSFLYEQLKIIVNTKSIFSIEKGKYKGFYAVELNNIESIQKNNTVSSSHRAF